MYCMKFSEIAKRNFQNKQGVHSDLHPVHGARGGVHVPESQRRGHPGPGRLLPRGTQEEVQLRHRPAGLQGSR